MKKFLIALAIVLSCATAASAAYPSIYELYCAWEDEGYPDYVAGVYSTDGSADHLTVQLADDPDGVFEAQLRQQLDDDTALTVEAGAYSYNDLLRINDEITQDYMVASTGSVMSCGVGWGSDGGFGPSGKEFRVVVSVLPEELESYRQLFAQTYGDAVVVREGAVSHDLLLEKGAAPDAPVSPDETHDGSAVSDAPASLGEAPDDVTPEIGALPDKDAAPVPMPQSTSGNTVVAVIVLALLVFGAAAYGVATRKNLQ